MVKYGECGVRALAWNFEEREVAIVPLVMGEARAVGSNAFRQTVSQTGIKSWLQTVFLQPTSGR